MSLLFGSGKRTKPQYSSLQVQTSSSNMPVTLAWGLCRLSPNCLWYGDFTAHKQTQGGKGGGGKGGGQYDYTAAIQLALCQGVSGGIQRIWVDSDKSSTLSKLNLVFFDGSDPQTPWSYLTANHPDAALAYPGLVHLDSPKYDLGSSASLPQHSFETECRLYNTAPGGVGDADVALTIQDYLVTPIFGCGFPSADVDTTSLLSGPDAPTTGDSAAQTYCTAMGFGMSPVLASQENGLTILKRWCDLFNLAPVWTGDTFKFIPYSLEPVSGNGVNFVPNTASVYSLSDSDYVQSDPSNPSDPVVVTRVDFTKVKNRLQLEILSRAKEYNAVPVEYVEQGLVEQYGDLPDSVFQGHEVTEPAMATKIVTIMVLRNAFRGANTYKFTLGPEFCLLEGMDLLDVLDPQFGLVQVQIDTIEEDDSGNLALECSMVAGAASNASGFAPPDQTPGGNDTGVASGDVNAPLIFEPPSSLAGDPEVWCAISGSNPNWGGANVWISTDNATYIEIGSVNTPSRQGLTTSALAAYGGANPDTVDSLGVDLTMSGGTLMGVSATDASNGATLCVVKDASGAYELISYRDATLTTTSHYTLAGQLYRGLYGTPPASHLSGVQFARLDNEIFKYKLPPQYIGVPLYFKFQSFNVYGGGAEDLSVCTAYTYTPSGAGYGTGTNTGTGQKGVPAAPTGLSTSAGAGFSKLAWTANSTNDNVDHYDVYRAAGPSGSFGSASKVGSTGGTTYTDTSGAAGTTYTYFVVGVNAIGAGNPSSGVDSTPSAPVLGAQPFGFAFGPKVPTASKILAMFDSPVAWTMPASLTNSQGLITASDTASAGAPTAQTDFDIQSPLGTSIATMRFASGSLTATFINAVGDSIAIGAPVYIVAPSNLNGITGAIGGSILGTRP